MSSRREWLGAALLVLAWVIVGLTLVFLQFSVDTVTDEDACYHIGMAQVLRERGLTRQFEWTQLSLWKDRYADKEFLFHLAMAPFVSGDPDRAILRAKLFICCVALGSFFAFGFALWSHRVPAVWLWNLVLLAASAHWLFRMNLIRSHVLSVGLALLGVHGLLAGSTRALAVLGFLYAWSYSAPHLLAAIAVVITASRWLLEGQLAWKPLAATVAGLAAGFLVHPYFPNNLINWWVQNVLVLLHVWGLWGPPELVLGHEFAPATTRLLTHASSLGLGIFVASSLAAAMARRRLGWQALSLLTLTWAFLVLEFLSRRFVEYFIPGAVLAGAFITRDLAAGFREEGPPAWARTRRLRLAAGTAAAAVLAVSYYATIRITLPTLQDFPRWEVGASEWIREHVPRGDTVLFLVFDQFPALFLRDRDHRYLMAMDPMFSYYSHPEETVFLAHLWLDPDPPEPKAVAEKLGGRYLIVQKYRWMPQLLLFVAKGARRVYDDEQTAILDLTPEPQT